MQLNHIAQYLFFILSHSNNTWHSRGSQQQCLQFFLFFCSFGSEKFCILKQNNAWKDKRFLINVRIQIIFGSIISDKKKKMLHGCRSEKCHVLFEWSLLIELRSTWSCHDLNDVIVIEISNPKLIVQLFFSLSIWWYSFAVYSSSFIR